MTDKSTETEVKKPKKAKKKISKKTITKISRMEAFKTAKEALDLGIKKAFNKFQNAVAPECLVSNVDIIMFGDLEGHEDLSTQGKIATIKVTLQV